MHKHEQFHCYSLQRPEQLVPNTKFIIQKTRTLSFSARGDWAVPTVTAKTPSPLDNTLNRPLQAQTQSSLVTIYCQKSLRAPCQGHDAMKVHIIVLCLYTHTFSSATALICTVTVNLTSWFRTAFKNQKDQRV